MSNFNLSKHDGPERGTTAVAAGSVRIKRRHGLGNVLCLLPVLDKLACSGREIEVIIDKKWIDVLCVLRPDYLWLPETNHADVIDLDVMTRDLHPTEHRSTELGRLLGLEPPFAPLEIIIPPSWERPFEQLRDCIIFAPEAGHSSRAWPADKVALLGRSLKGSPLILAGLNHDPQIPCDVDTRGKLELHELLGLLAVARVVITMDSGTLHLATALGTPTVALFGGIDPSFRIYPQQPVVALQAEMPCCPCNKNETCDGQFTCIRQIKVEEVIKAVKTTQTITARIIRRV